LKPRFNSIPYTFRSTRKSVHAGPPHENSFAQGSVIAEWKRCRVHNVP
jgi:hypothetical protein